MPFNIVLHQPEIPNNTGNIGRTCIATGCSLHLIRPFGFDTSVKALRRAGLDYWPRLAPTEHENWEAYERWLGSPSRDRETLALGADSSTSESDAKKGNGSESRSTTEPSNGPESRSTTEPSNGPESRSAAEGAAGSTRLWLYTTKCARPHWDVEIRPGDHLVFGKETAGLPDELLERYANRLVTLPMVSGERSLNVATAVCAAVYEGMRQCVARGEMAIDASGRARTVE